MPSECEWTNGTLSRSVSPHLYTRTDRPVTARHSRFADSVLLALLVVAAAITYIVVPRFAIYALVVVIVQLVVLIRRRRRS